MWNHDRGDGAQLRGSFSGVVEPTHMGIAGGENTIWMRVAWILLDRED
jgi:hypothetical protein